MHELDDAPVFCILSKFLLMQVCEFPKYGLKFQGDETIFKMEEQMFFRHHLSVFLWIRLTQQTYVSEKRQKLGSTKTSGRQKLVAQWRKIPHL